MTTHEVGVFIHVNTDACKLSIVCKSCLTPFFFSDWTGYPLHLGQHRRVLHSFLREPFGEPFV